MDAISRGPLADAKHEIVESGASTTTVKAYAGTIGDWVQYERRHILIYRGHRTGRKKPLGMWVDHDFYAKACAALAQCEANGIDVDQLVS